MHELGLVQRILEIAEAYARREGARAIRLIGLKVGALSGVEKSALEFVFEAAKQGTLAEKARLAVNWVPPVSFCKGCNVEFEVDNPFGIALCPLCNEPSATLRQGQELEVEYLEVV
ncbi:hydrogenase maturation nickel metallochaperone HypA [Meiothermus sp.]|uniref:hydrogenase maturation nickel metallochaperone HypA n=1 Tax=Meiothermus sp. TaxID=1955249 RepID=UPI00307DA624